MPDRFNTLAAFIVGISVLMFAWSVFTAWEPPLPARGGIVTESAQRSQPVPTTVAPTRVAAD